MKPTVTETSNKEVRSILAKASATALVIGLSATGAVYFTTGNATAAAAPPGTMGTMAGPSAMDTSHRVEKDLMVKSKDVKKTPTGVEFTSHDYADAIGMDRSAVIKGLQKKYPSVTDDQVKVMGDQIYINNPDANAFTIFENLCIHITLNLCKKS